MSVITKTLWNVNSAHIGGSWHIDSLRGLLDGVVYIKREDFEHREPKELTLRGSRGSVVTNESLEGATVGNVSMALLDDVSTSTLLAYQVTSGSTGSELEGLYQIDALYTETDNESGGGAVDAYTKGEVDDKVATLNQAVNKKANSADVYTRNQTDELLLNKVSQEMVAKVNKPSATTSYAVNQLGSSASLADTITKMNEVISCLMAVRGTNSSTYSATGNLVDALTNAKVMAS